MFHVNRSVIAAVAAVGLVGLVPGVAPAAPRQVCYFDDCVPTKAVPIPNQTEAPSSPTGGSDNIRTIAENGSWVAMSDGKMVMVMDRFEDGAKFAIAYSGRDVAVLVSTKSWSLHEGDTYTMKISVDGDVFTGKAVVIGPKTMLLDRTSDEFVREFYGSKKVEVRVADDTFTMTTISDAVASRDAAQAYRQTSAN